MKKILKDWHQRFDPHWVDNSNLVDLLAEKEILERIKQGHENYYQNFSKKYDEILVQHLKSKEAENWKFAHNYLMKKLKNEDPYSL